MNCFWPMASCSFVTLRILLGGPEGPLPPEFSRFFTLAQTREKVQLAYNSVLEGGPFLTTHTHLTQYYFWNPELKLIRLNIIFEILNSNSSDSRSFLKS